jgi:hypothetical protein
MEVVIAVVILVIAVLIMGGAPMVRGTAAAREAEMRARTGIRPRRRDDHDRL